MKQRKSNLSLSWYYSGWRRHNPLNIDVSKSITEGFFEVVQEQTFGTIFGTLALYRATKPNEPAPPLPVG